jgi:2,3-dihydroxybenzoate decarboxylase
LPADQAVPARRRIAIEEHFQGPGFVHDPVGAFKPQFARALQERIADFTEFRIPEMDQAGIDVQVLSTFAPAVQGETDPARAIELARANNDFQAEVIREHPARFAGLCSLPTQDPSAAAAELERGVTELGLKGAMINGHTGGLYLDDERYLPLWEKFAELGVPAYIHPVSTPGPWAPAEGYPEILMAAWGWAVETGSHALRLLYSGLFDRLPELQVIIGHMGEFLPFNLWRMDSRTAIFLEPHPLAHPPSHYVEQNFLITTSGVFSDPPLVAAVDALGPERILFAVDYPYESMEYAVQWIEHAPVDEGNRDLICHGNAERVLGV